MMGIKPFHDMYSRFDTQHRECDRRTDGQICCNKGTTECARLQEWGAYIVMRAEI